MPLYEYYCSDCQKEFTLLQSANVNKEETVCEECESGNVEHRPSTFSARIQGVSAASKMKPLTADEFPNKNILNLPLPRLRSEL